jgi:4-hydroxy-tetrahydrodipicolinate synthase
MIRLAQIDNIVGVKEASANYEQIAKIIDGVPREFMVFSGNDSDTLPILAMGGYGIVSVIGHLVGNQIREMMDDFVWGNADEAAKIHRHLLPLVNACFVVSNPIPVKYALNCVGFKVGKPRLPLTEPDPKAAKFIEETVAKYQVDLPVPLAH